MAWGVKLGLAHPTVEKPVSINQEAGFVEKGETIYIYIY